MKADDIFLSGREIKKINADPVLEPDDVHEWRCKQQTELDQPTQVDHTIDDDVDVYIERGFSGEVFGEVAPEEHGGLGNPFSVEEYGREKAIELFRSTFESKLQEDSDIQEYVAILQGKTLGCWC